METTTAIDRYADGYRQAQRQWQRCHLPTDDPYASLDMINPFVRGTEEWEGFEAALFDLTR